MNISIDGDDIKYNGRNYPLDGASIELTKRDRVKGYVLTISVTALLCLVYFLIFTTPLYHALFDYMFFVYFATFVPGVALYIYIFSRYILEYAVVRLDNDTRIVLFNHGINREMIFALIERMKRVRYSGFQR